MLKKVDAGIQSKWKKGIFQKSLSSGSIKQSISRIRVPSQKWKSSFKNEIIGKRHQLIIKRTFLFEP